VIQSVRSECLQLQQRVDHLERQNRQLQLLVQQTFSSLTYSTLQVSFVIYTRLSFTAFTCVLSADTVLTTTTTTTTTVLWPLCTSTCVTWHLQLRTGGFCWCKFYCPHALADGNPCIWIRERMLEFSTVLSILSLCLIIEYLLV